MSRRPGAPESHAATGSLRRSGGSSRSRKSRCPDKNIRRGPRWAYRDSIAPCQTEPPRRDRWRRSHHSSPDRRRPHSRCRRTCSRTARCPSCRVWCRFSPDPPVPRGGRRPAESRAANRDEASEILIAEKLAAAGVGCGVLGLGAGLVGFEDRVRSLPLREAPCSDRWRPKRRLPVAGTACRVAP